MLACPRCESQLRVVRYRDAAVHRCPRCGGHAVTYPVIRDALERGRWQRLWKQVMEGASPVGPHCPGCGKRMNEVREGRLALDSCRGCYLLWFDARELEALPVLPPAVVPPAAVREAAARERVAREASESDSGPPESGWQRVCGFLGLPFEVDSPAARRAYVTAGLVVSLIAVHLVAASTGLWRAIGEWGFVPALAGRHGGATWITSFFLHAGWLHLFSNGYFLAVFGDNVEEDLGSGRYLLLVVLGTLLGVALHALSDPRSEIPLVGASAGISAVLFYYAFRFPKARIGWALRYGFIPIYWFRMTARTAFGIWLGFQLLLAVLQTRGLTSVSAMGHLGGVGAGVLFVLFRRSVARGDRYASRRNRTKY